MSARLARLLPEGPVSAWPDNGDWEDDSDGYDKWIVGVARRYFGAPGHAVLSGDDVPGCWSEIAEVNGRDLALALAEHLDEMGG